MLLHSLSSVYYHLYFFLPLYNYTATHCHLPSTLGLSRTKLKMRWITLPKKSRIYSFIHSFVHSFIHSFNFNIFTEPRTSQVLVGDVRDYCSAPCPVQHSKRHCDLKKRVLWAGNQRTRVQILISVSVCATVSKLLTYIPLQVLCKRIVFLSTSQKMVGNIKLHNTFECIKYKCKG